VPSLSLTWHAGFPEAACARALATTSGDASRALDWLLANPLEAAHAAAGLPARPAIYSMGFAEDMVQLALVQADGNEELAINLLLNDQVHRVSRAPSAPVSDNRAIFAMGFDPELVRRALRQARNREDVAVELLVTGNVNEGSADGFCEDSGAEDEEIGPAPGTWTGTQSAFRSAIDSSIDVYMQWATSALPASFSLIA
jgi:uncharacterized UBP type Zn finger protein